MSYYCDVCGKRMLYLQWLKTKHCWKCHTDKWKQNNGGR